MLEWLTFEGFIVKKKWIFFLLALSFSGFLFFQVLWDTISPYKRYEDLNLESETVLKDRLGIKKIPQYLIVTFWASWCTSCINELFKLDQFIKETPKDVQLILINLDEENSKFMAEKILKNYPNFFNIWDEHKIISSYLQISRIPSTLFFIKGEFENILEGEVDLKKILEHLQ